MPSAEVVCVGDELLSGRVTDTNSGWLGARLAEAGWRLVRVATVPDELDAVADAVAAACARVPLVLVTGGLGGTSDDLTREALARVAGRPVVRDPRLEQALRDRYAKRAAEPPAGALAMADVVEGAEVLANPAGTAPGLRLRVGGAQVVALPGVPAEVRAIAAASVLPGLAGGERTTTSLWLPLADEAAVGDALGPLEAALPDGVRLGYLAGGGSTEVRLTGLPEVVAPLAARARTQLRAALPAALVLDEPLPASVLAVLRGAGETLAVAESLTGGLVTAALVAVPGASAVLRAGVVSYATELKAGLLGVDAGLLAERGAVDPDVARQMAEGVRLRTGATWGVATTGVAGPEPQDGRPVGEVHVAAAREGEVRVRSVQLRGDRDRVRTTAVVTALVLLREAIQ
ncbi:competence/damage-inducible protein cinA [Motilibacter rhizosphaerae]|uniref:CinA-like protein n=1 Tax=Motilibacter rhizosphaerae TaxID=598652 RepID=A0A4Q7NNW2_9ACTN|nr:nicotinamide-nucleotide amidohydrolase family protein [Motilibacter rhizosphaerae]RZS86929.1 competence/damage-inducible protein cinA [Motilibacter rhizosphaerae]